MKYSITKKYPKNTFVREYINIDLMKHHKEFQDRMNVITKKLPIVTWISTEETLDNQFRPVLIRNDAILFNHRTVRREQMISI